MKNIFSTNGIDSRTRASREDSVERYVNFRTAITSNVCKLTTGDYCSTWYIAGLPFEGLSSDDIIAKMNSLNTFIRGLSNGKYAFWVHRIRREITDRLGTPESGFAKSLLEKYYSGLGANGMMATEIYLTVLYRPVPRGAARLFTKRGNSLEEIEQEELQAVEAMENVGTQVNSSLNSYSPHRLGVYEQNNIRFSEQREFYGYLVNGFWQQIAEKPIPLQKQLCTSRLFFGDKFMESRNSQGSIYSCFVDIKDYADYSEPGILNSMLGLPNEYVETHSFAPMATIDALDALRRQRNQLSSGGDQSTSQIQALNDAMDKVQSGSFSFGEYHYSMQVKGADTDSVKQAAAMAIEQLAVGGFLGTSVDLVVDQAWAAQLPGNFKNRPRTAKLSSKNFTGLCALHNFASGKRNDNPWGEAVTILSSPTSQPLYFNFHNSPANENSFDKKVLGNTQIIGQSGSGKTVLALFLLANLMKTGAQMVYFDKDRGAEIALRAFGAKYLPLERGMPTGFAPFKMEPTPENMQFWFDLILFCGSQKGREFSPKDISDVRNAVEALAGMDQSERGFDMVRQSLPTDEGDGISSVLEKWTTGNQFGWALDCDEDLLDFDQHQIYGFDYTEILDDPDTCPAVMMYLMYRVEKQIDGRRFAFFMDEYWKALSIGYFQDFAKNKQKTIRKQNGFGVYMSQSPSDTLSSEIAKPLIEQTATWIYLPNPTADRTDYVEGFKLTESEFEIVRSLGENSRMFLVKQGHSTSIGRLDLAGFSDELKVLSGTTDNVERLDQLRARLGDHPDNWLVPFMKGEQ